MINELNLQIGEAIDKINNSCQSINMLILERCADDNTNKVPVEISNMIRTVHLSNINDAIWEIRCALLEYEEYIKKL